MRTEFLAGLARYKYSQLAAEPIPYPAHSVSNILSGLAGERWPVIFQRDISFPSALLCGVSGKINDPL